MLREISILLLISIIFSIPYWRIFPINKEIFNKCYIYAKNSTYEKCLTDCEIFCEDFCRAFESNVENCVEDCMLTCTTDNCSIDYLSKIPTVCPYYEGYSCNDNKYVKIFFDKFSSCLLENSPYGLYSLDSLVQVLGFFNQTEPSPQIAEIKGEFLKRYHNFTLQNISLIYRAEQGTSECLEYTCCGNCTMVGRCNPSTNEGCPSGTECKAECILWTYDPRTGIPICEEWLYECCYPPDVCSGTFSTYSECDAHCSGTCNCTEYNKTQIEAASNLTVYYKRCSSSNDCPGNSVCIESGRIDAIGIKEEGYKKIGDFVSESWSYGYHFAYSSGFCNWNGSVLGLEVTVPAGTEIITKEGIKLVEAGGYLKVYHNNSIFGKYEAYGCYPGTFKKPDMEGKSFGCCYASECWDGEKCVPNGTKIGSYVCWNGKWEIMGLCFENNCISEPCNERYYVCELTSGECAAGPRCTSGICTSSLTEDFLGKPCYKQGISCNFGYVVKDNLLTQALECCYGCFFNGTCYYPNNSIIYNNSYFVCHNHVWRDPDESLELCSMLNNTKIVHWIGYCCGDDLNESYSCDWTGNCGCVKKGNCYAFGREYENGYVFTYLSGEYSESCLLSKGVNPPSECCENGICSAYCLMLKNVSILSFTECKISDVSFQAYVCYNGNWVGPYSLEDAKECGNVTFVMTGSKIFILPAFILNITGGEWFTVNIGNIFNYTANNTLYVYGVIGRNLGKPLIPIPIEANETVTVYWKPTLNISGCCCGDDIGNEFLTSRICVGKITCTIDLTDIGCAKDVGSCVYNGKIYSNDTVMYIPKEINITVEVRRKPNALYELDSILSRYGVSIWRAVKLQDAYLKIMNISGKLILNYYEKRKIPIKCINGIWFGTCGNGICEEWENTENCPEDCCSISKLDPLCSQRIPLKCYSGKFSVCLKKIISIANATINSTVTDEDRVPGITYTEDPKILFYCGFRMAKNCDEEAKRSYFMVLAKYSPFAMMAEEIMEKVNASGICVESIGTGYATCSLKEASLEGDLNKDLCENVFYGKWIKGKVAGYQRNLTCIYEIKIAGVEINRTVNITVNFTTAEQCKYADAIEVCKEYMNPGEVVINGTFTSECKPAIIPMYYCCGDDIGEIPVKERFVDFFGALQIERYSCAPSPVLCALEGKVYSVGTILNLTVEPYDTCKRYFEELLDAFIKRDVTKMKEIMNEIRENCSNYSALVCLNPDCSSNETVDINDTIAFNIGGEISTVNLTDTMLFPGIYRCINGYWVLENVTLGSLRLPAKISYGILDRYVIGGVSSPNQAETGVLNYSEEDIKRYWKNS